MRGYIFVLILVLVSVISVSASDVAYVLKNTRNPNKDFLNAFSELNLSVKLISNKNIDTINFTKYKLIFVGNEMFNNADEIPVNDFNSVIANSFHLMEFGLTYDTVSQVVSNMPLEVIKDNKFLTIYNKCCYSNSIGIPIYYLSYLNKNENVKTLVSYETNEEDAVVGLIKKRSSLSNGKTSKGNICFFGITETRYWTNDAKELFKGCVSDTLKTQRIDKDNDGFSEDEDCDDNNSRIFPGAVEIPNNGIDEDCDGNDLIIIEPPKPNITNNKTVSVPFPEQTEVEINLIRQRDNRIVGSKIVNLNANQDFFNLEDFSVNFKLSNDLETGFYDIVFIGRVKDHQCKMEGHECKEMKNMCMLNNSEVVKLTIFVEGVNQ